MYIFNNFLLSTLDVFLYTSISTATNQVETTFLEYKIVPDVIAKAPVNPLKIIYEGTLAVNYGNELTPTQVKSQPKVAWNAVKNAFYTLIMTDPDVPSRIKPQMGEMKHWLVGNIIETNIEEADVLAAYVGSGPELYTGLHRYVFLLYKQREKVAFEEASVGNDSILNRQNFKAAAFAKKYKLGGPIAGNFYQAQYDDYTPIIHQQLLGK